MKKLQRTTRDVSASRPTILGAEDGYLTETDLENGAIVTITYPNITGGDSSMADRLTLHWETNGVDLIPLGVYYVTAQDFSANLVTLTVPKDSITDGQVVVWIFQEDRSGNKAKSLEASVTVDTQTPGGEVLGPIDFSKNPALDDDVLHASEIESGVSCIVPNYLGMAQNDRIHLRWGEQEDSATDHLVTLLEVGQGVPMTFTQKMILDEGDGRILATYNVTDTAGHISPWARVRIVTSRVSVFGETPAAPIVVGAEDDGTISADEARPNVILQIAPYATMSANDAIEAYWGIAQAPVHIISPAEVDVSFNVKVPYETVAAQGDGVVDVYYDVARPGYERSRSEVTTVTVEVNGPGGFDPDPLTPANEGLPLPVIRDSSNTNTLSLVNAAEAGNGVNVAIAAYENIAAGDSIVAYWGTQVLPAYSVTPADASGDTPILIAVNASVISTQGDGESIAVRYAVTDARGNTPFSPDTPIRVYTLLPGGVTGLEPEVIPASLAEPNAGWINESEALTQSPTTGVTGIDIEIAPYENMRNDDTLTVTWQGYTDNTEAMVIDNTHYTESHLVALYDLDDEDNIVLTVPTVYVTQMQNYGWAVATYEVVTFAGDVVVSSSVGTNVDVVARRARAKRR
ncbi:MAG: hypothetical protein WDN30_16295, partial [Pararobbsia sp.]